MFSTQPAHNFIVTKRKDIELNGLVQTIIGRRRNHMNQTMLESSICLNLDNMRSIPNLYSGLLIFRKRREKHCSDTEETDNCMFLAELFLLLSKLK